MPTNARQQDVSQQSTAATAGAVNPPGSKKASKAAMTPEPAAGITSSIANATAVKPSLATSQEHKVALVDTASAAAAVTSSGIAAVPAPAAIAASRLPQAGSPQVSATLISTADNPAHETASLAPAKRSEANARQRKKQRSQIASSGGSSSVVGASTAPAMTGISIEPRMIRGSAKPSTSTSTAGPAPQAAQARNRQNGSDTAAASSQVDVTGSAATAIAAHAAVPQSSSPDVGSLAEPAVVSKAAGGLRPNPTAAGTAGSPPISKAAGQSNSLKSAVAVKASGNKAKVCFSAQDLYSSC